MPESRSHGNSQADEQAGEARESDPEENSTAEPVLQRQGKVDMLACDRILHCTNGFVQCSETLPLAPGGAVLLGTSIHTASVVGYAQAENEGRSVGAWRRMQ